MLIYIVVNSESNKIGISTESEEKATIASFKDTDEILTTRKGEKIVIIDGEINFIYDIDTIDISEFDTEESDTMSIGY